MLQAQSMEGWGDISSDQIMVMFEADRRCLHHPCWRSSCQKFPFFSSLHIFPALLTFLVNYSIRCFNTCTWLRVLQLFSLRMFVSYARFFGSPSHKFFRLWTTTSFHGARCGGVFFGSRAATPLVVSSHVSTYVLLTSLWIRLKWHRSDDPFGLVHEFQHDNFSFNHLCCRIFFSLSIQICHYGFQSFCSSNALAPKKIRRLVFQPRMHLFKFCKFGAWQVFAWIHVCCRCHRLSGVEGTYIIFLNYNFISTKFQ